jgi:hypothetical protein
MAYSKSPSFAAVRIELHQRVEGRARSPVRERLRRDGAHDLAGAHRFVRRDVGRHVKILRRLAVSEMPVTL